MNAEEYDIERLIRKDVKSIKIDQDFKAKLKADIMGNGAKSEDKVIVLNNHPKMDADNKRKRVHFNRYLKIASCIAIAGVMGVKFALGGAMVAKNEGNQDVAEIKVTDKVVVAENILTKHVEPKENSDEVKGTEKEKKQENTQGIRTEVASNSKNDETQGQDNDKQEPVENKAEENVQVAVNEENPENSENQNPVETEEGSNQDEEGTGVVVVAEAGNEGINDDILSEKETTYMAPNNKNIEVSSEEILSNYSRNHNLDLYNGEELKTEDQGYYSQDNTLFVNTKEGSNEVVCALDQQFIIKGVKKVGESVLIACVEEGATGMSIKSVNIETKEVKTLGKSVTEKVLFARGYENFVFEKDGKIKIVDVISGKVTTIAGKFSALKPDGTYLSYVKEVSYDKEKDGSEKVMVLAAYNFKNGKETYLEKSELIQVSDQEKIGRYVFGKHLWSRDNKCIYMVREAKDVVSDNAEDRVNVVRLEMEN